MSVMSIEIDLVVSDSLKAMEQYEQIFHAERMEASSFGRGRNEVVFMIGETRFHLLDENPGYQLFAPEKGRSQSLWFNLVVTDIEKTYLRAMQAGCREVQPVKLIPELGIANAMFEDSFGYVWMLHQIYREMSFQERCRAMATMPGQ